MSELELRTETNTLPGSTQTEVWIYQRNKNMGCVLVPSSIAPALVARIEGKDQQIQMKWAYTAEAVIGYGELEAERDELKAEVKRLQELIAGRYNQGGRSEIDYQNELGRLKAENERLKQELLIERGVANVACHFLANPHSEPEEDEECPCQSCSSLRDDAALATPEEEEKKP